MGRRQGIHLGLTRAPRYSIFLLLTVLSVLAAVAQQQPSGPARKVFVDAFQGKLGAAHLREAVVARLRASHEVQLVDSAPEADLIVSGNGETWLKGYLAVNPHAAPSTREAVYGGYLSLEVERGSGEMLWSYLVTPSRMHWSGVNEDMADHIVRLMLPVLKQADARAAQSLPASQGRVTLSGAGSTFSAPLYQSWIESYEDRHPEVHTTYQAVGSEDGIQLLEEGKVDFAASDVPVSDEQMASIPVKVNQYATVLGGVVPAYNLEGAGRDLNFTPEVLAAIYLGKITRWNDSRVRAINRGTNLPDAPIVVLHRSDGSGTSYAWTEFLSRTSPEWKTSVGSGMKVAWPAGEGVAGNEGLAAKVAETPGAIGYVELTYAIRHELSFGLVRNAAGRFVQASLESLSEAAMAASTSRDLRDWLVNGPGKDAYPIATFTWILLPRGAANDAKALALKDLVHWMLTAGQKECSGLGYVPLPKDLADRELSRESAGSASAL
jgi:phosphate ABC transporter phosphate-binding protein